MDNRIASVFTFCVITFALRQDSTMVFGDQDEDIPHNEVRNWALKFGVDVWEFGRQFTNINNIKNRYSDYDVEVVRKDGIVLLKDMATEVKNFMDFKKHSVMRIMDSAEQAALSESDPETKGHSSSLSSTFYDARRINEYNADGKLADGARHMDLKFMRRFERLPVNISISSILVPNGIDLDSSEVKSALAWSSHLDPLFANNLERDPALSWQYFGSSTGFLRRFPGTAWPPEGSKGSKQISDFRAQNWFVQAASSPKDIMILLETSSGISDTNFELAITTAFAILDTLSENDFFSLVTFSDTIASPVPCFKDKMVSATPDNIKEIKDAVKAVKPDNKANFTAGLEYAFGLLHKYNQSGNGSQCNQAIMLITEGTSEPQVNVIKHFNWPHRPVRIFTYLIGGDSGGKANLYDMACTNKGYFVQINSAEEARDKVIEYALVMARPMVMYQQDHPVHWSPVFVAGMSSGLGKENNNKRRLVTTVSTPVFDRRNHSTRTANLLGVVGTDVPLEEIQKMIPQFKLGVNGYSFILDNNGRVLYHPDLRPITDSGQYIEKLKPRYSSVDISEIELPDTEFQEDLELQDENKNLLYDMRHEMIQQHKGETEFRVLSHFDGMKRVTTRLLKYFYGPIEGTPFTLALALPDKYGSHELVSHQEIRHSRNNVTDYFKGDNWRVHPDWVYCEYNSVSDLEKERENSGEILSRDQEPSFSTPEEQVLHFLSRAGRPGWKWMSVRPRSPQQHHGHGGSPLGHFAQHINNGQGTRKAEPYFCDRTLLQTLVRDAMITDSFDKPSAPSTHKEVHPIATLMALLARQGISMFNVTTSFVATRSGLLRWVNHMEHPPDSPEPHFSEINTRAMDMSWYKRAVDQYAVEPESFVYSVPFDSGYTDSSNATLVTATHAIFIEHRGHKAPAAVVGLMFRHDSLARHFVNITSACSGCHKTCASDELDCYLLDNNGFIIMSENSEHTGKFFGQIDGTIMDSLVQDRIYKRITVMDYQGVCSDKENPYTAAGHIPRPSKPMEWVVKYLLSFTTTWMSFVPLPPVGSWPAEQYTDVEDYELEVDSDAEDGEYTGEYDAEQYSDLPGFVSIEEPTTKDYEKTTLPPPKIQIHPSGPRTIPDPKHARTCDLKTDLFVLQPERLNQSGQNNPLKGKLTNCHASGCERPFSVQKIPHSNLILLVVDTLCPCGSKQLDIEPEEIPGGAGACGSRRQARENLSRKRPSKCISYHPEEVEIQQCGRGSHMFTSSIVISQLIVLFIAFVLTQV